MIKFKIMQIKDIGHTDYAFRSYDPKKFNIEDYEIRYEAESEVVDKSNLELCDIIFLLFNTRRPSDFKGHSLSMSDLVWIERDGRCSLYYCDMCGWIKIKEVRA